MKSSFFSLSFSIASKFFNKNFEGSIVFKLAIFFKKKKLQKCKIFISNLKKKKKSFLILQLLKKISKIKNGELMTNNNFFYVFNKELIKESMNVKDKPRDIEDFV